ncbi:PfkB family carbohydrate kinase [Roseomonas sp. NAR14]|uniref:2-dehydro-3-deoxygluconokinase n=1 Tax=Roseomonas acroporae TaxID=2937791 RepID=A0A9X2BTM6_9PROT|nr:sugar kinase [Roseomonas acroporae]MCK8783386.1 PfkB family carbohydrate kinase [Roseomonas acroporae]
MSDPDVKEPAPRRVACLGECMMELRERPDGLLSRGFGGDTLNTALYLARLGAPVEYVTALGDDPFSAAMLAAWREEGIGTDHVLRVPGRLPGLYLIQTDPAGERRFSYWRDSAPARQLFALPETPVVERALAGAAVAYLSGITLSLYDEAGRERLFATLATTRARGGRVVFDTNFRPRGWPDPAVARAVYDRMIRLADTVLAGVEDNLLLHGDDGPAPLAARLRAAGVAEAVVKLAEPGCLVLDGDRAVPVPTAPDPSPVDTTAAGDSFAAGYLAARLRGEPPEAAARAGHALAGVVVRHPGAIIPRAAMPDLFGPRTAAPHPSDPGAAMPHEMPPHSRTATPLPPEAP